MLEDLQHHHKIKRPIRDRQTLVEIQPGRGEPESESHGLCHAVPFHIGCVDLPPLTPEHLRNLAVPSSQLKQPIPPEVGRGISSNAAA
jgi:hypothetical protein